MNSNQRPPSAKIYQFRAKPSASRIGSREVIQTAEDRKPVSLPVEFGSGWYHEAALQAELSRKL
jgi:hypothetical protein